MKVDKPLEKKLEASAREDFGLAPKQASKRELMIRELREALESATLLYDSEHDDWQPSYSWFSKIQSQISRAQSGRGPIRMRLVKIAVLAIAGIESIDRKDES
jgi:hypothetical protein